MWKVLSYFSLLKITDKHKIHLELICFRMNWSLLCECCPLQVDPVKLRQALKCVTLNQLFISGPIVVVVYYLMSLRGNPCGPELPTFHWALTELAFFSIVEEILFYYSHRWGSLLCYCVKSHSSDWVLLTSFHQHEHLPLSSLRLFHYPHLYKRFHKQHHEWTAPIGVVATYAHPLEHVVGGHFQSLQGSVPGRLAVTNPNICCSSLLQLSNLLPVVIGPVILGSHISTTCMWYCVALISTTVSHCGYHLPFLPSPEFHDFHHLRCVHLSNLLIYFWKYLHIIKPS